MMDRIDQKAAVVSIWLRFSLLPDWLDVSGPTVTWEVNALDWIGVDGISSKYYVDHTG
jgi:hypothetical protein